jgi:DNA-binding NarL/FixJ family response regulator
MRTRLRVVIADDHPIYRDGLKAALSNSDVEIIGEATDGPAAVALAETLVPDVVLMDLHMPGGGGLDATRAITAANTAVAVLILTMSEQDDALLAALRVGARGYLNKVASRDELLDCIRAVASGQSVFGPGLAEKLIGEVNRRQRAPVLPVLTDREREILQLVADGYTNGAIARRFVLSPKTVRNHVSNILTKLNARDRTDAARIAREAGLRTTEGLDGL